MTIVESARAALIVAAKLAEDGMIPIAQTSGSKGIQVYAAIAPTRSKTVELRQAAQRSLHKAQPDFFVSTMSIEQRAGRIYVDYNQNLAARNTIAPYSMRGRERPAVATPVTWEELGSVRRPDDLRFARMRLWRESPNMVTWHATCSPQTRRHCPTKPESCVSDIVKPHSNPPWPARSAELHG